MADTFDIDYINNRLGQLLANGQIALAQTYYDNMVAKGASPSVLPPGRGTLSAPPVAAPGGPQTPGVPQTPSPAPIGGTIPAGSTPPPTSAIEQIKGLYPWLDKIGLSPNDLIQWVGQENLDGTGIVAKVRTLPQYKERFPGIYRNDGTMRMNESQYMSTEDNLRQVLGQYGKTGYDNPSDLAAFFQGDIDPNELATRLKTYTDVENGGQFIKNAFYVYGGMKVSTDDLYQAAVDPGAADRLKTAYNQAITANQPDYMQFITRATEAGMATVADTVSQLERSGALPAGASAQALSSLQPDQARLVMDSLYHGGSHTGPFLDLDQLTHAFQYAMIGSAATGQGLQLTDQSMVEQLRQAGVDRAKALSTYGTIAAHGNELNAELQRAQMNTFTQQDFEKALFLNSGQETDALARAQAQEKALGDAGGKASFSLQGGQLAQQGLSVSAA